MIDKNNNDNEVLLPEIITPDSNKNDSFESEAVEPDFIEDEHNIHFERKTYTSMNSVVAATIAILFLFFGFFCALCILVFKFAVATLPIWGGFLILLWLFG